MPTNPDESRVPTPAQSPALTQITEALKDLRYGEVTVIVQDGVIVQIDRLEKRRLHPGANLPRG